MGIDIGGTFTDLVAQGERGEFWRVKVPTTPEDPAQGALLAVQKFLEEKARPGSVQVVIHATTLAANALLTNTLPRTALVTTEGFRDVLEIGGRIAQNSTISRLSVSHPLFLGVTGLKFESE